MNEPLFLGSEEIAAMVRIGTREIARYVRDYGMPAFQVSGKNGKWRATATKLAEWALEFEKRCLDKEVINE